jgi:hypothetical protein
MERMNVPIDLLLLLCHHEVSKRPNSHTSTSVIPKSYFHDPAVFCLLCEHDMAHWQHYETDKLIRFIRIGTTFSGRK